MKTVVIYQQAATGMVRLGLFKVENDNSFFPFSLRSASEQYMDKHPDADPKTIRIAFRKRVGSKLVESEPRRLTFYNFKKDTCDRCGITKEAAKKFPVDTGINHPQYRYSTSFALDYEGGVLCARCSREKGLEDLFKLMDAKERS